MRQRGWRGWHTKVSSIGDIGRNIRVVCQTESQVVQCFSNSFLNHVENEYYSRLEKKIQVLGHIQSEHIYFFFIFPWILEFKVTLKFFPEQTQNSGIFRTRGIGTLPNSRILRFLKHSKFWYIENLRHIQNTVNLLHTVYTELSVI